MSAVPVSPTSSLLPLEYPQSVAVFDNYQAAQKAVDFLSDDGFPVQNLCIVGTDLKLVERVVGRRGWPQVVSQGAVSGVGTGVLLGLVWWMLMPNVGFGSAFLLGLVFGVLIGIMSAVISHAATHGQRDFNSISATVATRYEVLGEHNVVAEARQKLAAMPGARAAEFGGSSSFGGTISGSSAAPASQAQQYPPQYGQQPQQYGQQPQQYGQQPHQYGQTYQQSYGQYGQQDPTQPTADQPGHDGTTSHG